MSYNLQIADYGALLMDQGDRKLVVLILQMPVKDFLGSELNVLPLKITFLKSISFSGKGRKKS